MSKEKIETKFTLAFAGITTSLVTNIPALKVVALAEGGISATLGSVANSVLTEARNIVFPILAVMTVFYGIKIVIAPDAKTCAEAKHSAIICLIGALIVLFAPTIFDTIKGALGKQDTKFTFDTSVG